ncbi:MAG: ABC transporter ATP-binding protein [Clostridium sp.]|nr:ABC transporter ATP-binding protein [Clostridium sp.]
MTVIEFKNVTKYFNIYQNKSNSIKEKFINRILNRNKLEVNKMFVLKDASYKIEKGQTVGIIGENGTGKSTSLKLMSNILKPNSGEIKVNGKISSLLEIGVGFQPDLTGRENTYLYGSILGLSKSEIHKKYDDIVEFSELEKFMDTPVKNYSSGMYMRLAFSVAVSVNPDILLVDEVLSVGDANFQKKCINKIMDFKKRGKTIVYVSHDMSTVRRICDKVIFIKRGGYITEGSPERMIGLYMKRTYSADEEEKEKIDKYIENNKGAELSSDFNIEMHEAKEFINGNRDGNRELEITKLYFSDKEGRPRNFYGTEEDIKVNLEFKKNKDIKSAVLVFKIYTEEGWMIAQHNCKQDGILITDMKENNVLSFTIKNDLFLKSKYYFSVGLMDEECKEIYDFREKHYWFYIHESNIKEEGKIKVRCDWQL